VDRVLLVRHWQSNGLPEPDDGLTDLGLDQAVALEKRLGEFGIDRVLCSPYRRARQTIAPLLAASGLQLDIDERLRERRLAAWFTTEAERFEFVRGTFDDPDLRQPGGESSREASLRGWSALHEALAAPARLPVLVSHGQLLSLVLTRPSASPAGRR
jgi:2,3-bisphosphoglycerate-dependent phosphoglycerate mutase